MMKTVETISGVYVSEKRGSVASRRTRRGEGSVAAILVVFFVLIGACVCEPHSTPCESERDCPSGYVCEGGACVLPAGKACSRDEDCLDGEVCDEESRLCVAGPDCHVVCTAGALRCSNSVVEQCASSGCGWREVEKCGEGDICHDARCCSIDQMCGPSCCSEGEICFASACVVAGDSCLTHSDCQDGQFCEHGLGSPEEVPGPHPGDVGDGRVCLGPAPTPGRCISLPPRCSDPSADPHTCIRDDCEFRPEPGPLDAVVRWQWGQGGARWFPDDVDVWSTPAVGRIYDTNCDGSIDERDPPAIVFVAADVKSRQCAAGGAEICKQGVLRAIDGQSGEELWAIDRPEEGSRGFAGISVAIGDVTGDGRMDIVAASGEGHVFVIDGDGNVLRKSDEPIEGESHQGFGWGGALSLGDMDGDGAPEIAYADQVFTTRDGGLTRLFVGGEGTGSALGGEIDNRRRAAVSVMVDLTGDGALELLAGRTVYSMDGGTVWNREDLPDGFPAVADMNGDGFPEVVLVGDGRVWVLAGATGDTLLGPFSLPGSGRGGPPTIADFTGDNRREIGVATQSYYSAIALNFEAGVMTTLWSSPAHDFSSSVTGSTVFDFEGDGRAEVVYNDECFLWVYDGPTGDVKFLGYTSSFTATEATLVADVTGDGKAEILLIHNGVDMNSWHCAHHVGDPDDTWPAWLPPDGHPYYRGITLFGDATSSWVGTRPLWNQHAYHVTNVCYERDSACNPPRPEGAIPESQVSNWSLPWLNNFRQNVQESGLFDAPDAVVSLVAECSSPVRLRAGLRNRGPALLPAGVEVGFFVRFDGADTMIGKVTTDTPLFPGQATTLVFEVPGGTGGTLDTFVAKVLGGPFRECDEGNNESAPAVPMCLG